MAQSSTACLEPATTQPPPVTITNFVAIIESFKILTFLTSIVHRFVENLLTKMVVLGFCNKLVADCEYNSDEYKV